MAQGPLCFDPEGGTTSGTNGLRAFDLQGSAVEVLGTGARVDFGGGERRLVQRSREDDGVVSRRLSTFAFGPIRWGTDGEVIPPPGTQAFETEVSLAPELDATLLITAVLETETGRATWHFVTLDTNTGDLPEDGTVGFLPPNQTQPEGGGAWASSWTHSRAYRPGLSWPIRPRSCST